MQTRLQPPSEALPTTDVAAAVVAQVCAWFEQSARELPWRDDQTSAWGILVCEVMSQQTPVARVAPAWNEWMAKWPTPADLAAASAADVIRAWNRLGYPRRALWLRDAASKIVAEFGGDVPASYEELLTLPGVGDYTASAVAAFAFDVPVPVLDTNVRRVLARLMVGIERPTSASATVAERRLATALLPADGPEAALWSVACMEFGSVVCRASSPDCESCPVRRHCAWTAAGRPVSQTPTRSSQRFEGTDRQVRGKLLAILRASNEPVAAVILAKSWPDEIQRSRCLDSLISDGLVEPLAQDRYQLPG